MTAFLAKFGIDKYVILLICLFLSLKPIFYCLISKNIKSTSADEENSESQDIKSEIETVNDKSEIETEENQTNFQSSNKNAMEDVISSKPKPDRLISSSEAFLIEAENRALIRKMKSEGLIVDYDEKDLAGDDDDDIEIVDVDSSKVNIPSSAIIPTLQQGLSAPILRLEKNIRLKKLIHEQNRARREQELIAAAEAAAEKQRKKEERRARRRMENGNDEPEDEAAEEENEGCNQNEEGSEVKDVDNNDDMDIDLDREIDNNSDEDAVISRSLHNLRRLKVVMNLVQFVH